jgi:hypothetical protein
MNRVLNILKFNISKIIFSKFPSRSRFYNLMLSESFILNKKYLENNFIIHNSEAIDKCRETGAIIAFIHYGSFFLIGPALIHHKRCKYTAIASLDNTKGSQRKFWESFHERFNKYYSHNLILRSSYPRKFISLLKSPYFIGVALDVHTKRKHRKIKKYRFQNKDIYLDDYVGTLSSKYSKPVIACTINYDSYYNTHRIFLSEPIDQNENVTLESINFINTKSTDHFQFFHDFLNLFSTISNFK